MEIIFGNHLKNLLKINENLSEKVAKTVKTNKISRKTKENCNFPFSRQLEKLRQKIRIPINRDNS